MAQFQSEIELRVKVLDKELADLEKRIAKVSNPFSASGSKRNDKRLAAAKTAQKAELDLIRQAVEAEDRLRETKAQKRVQTNLRRIRFLRDERIKAAKQSEAAAAKAAKQRQNRIQGLQLGVGFPLLFGGGAGSVAGGALGALTDSSGGFGGQILFSAIGQTLDTFVQGLGELGQALNPITADVDKVVKSAGLANTELGKSITELENTAGAAVALKEATKELERVVGEDGVAALREFGDRFTILGNQLAEFFTQVQVAVAKLLQETPTEKNLRTTGETIFQARGSDNTEIQDAVSRLDNSSTPNERLAIQKEIVALVNEEADARQRELELMAASTGEAAEKLANSEMELRILNAKYALEQAGSDLTSDTVYELSKKVIQQEYFKELQDAINKGLVAEGLLQAGNIAELKMKIKLAALANQRAAALAKPTGGGGSAPQSKALQLQQQLVKEELKRAEIGVKQTQIDQGEEAALKAKQSLLVERLAKETEVLELQRQQALENNKVAGDAALINQVYDSRVQTTTDQMRLELALNQQRQKALILERELAVLADERNKAAALASRDTNIEQLGLDLANPFGGFDYEQQSLQLQQAAESTALLRAEQEKLSNLERTQADEIIGTEQYKILGAQIDRQRQYMSDLEGRIAKENELEMAILKQNQTLQALQPITDGLAAGITDFFTSVIDGSKSAEEAFADMLKGMAAALIQQGAQMIAQYMAIALARALAGMGGGGGVPTPLTSGLDFSSAFAGRASGGPVNGNAPYIVGENGPELFVPGKSGTVVNNDDFADAAAAMGSGSSSFEESGESMEMATAQGYAASGESMEMATAQGYAASSKALQAATAARGGNTSAALAGAIQAFADSGSAMAAASSNRSSNSAAAAQASALQTAESYFSTGKSTVTFDTYRVGEMDVVTREDAMKIGMESAKKAEANVYKGLRNMPAVRGRSGVK